MGGHEPTAARIVSATVLLMATLAVARATRLVTTDSVGAPARRALARRFPPFNVPDFRPETGTPIEGTGRLVASWPVRFVSCDWCVGLWLALGAAALLRAWLPVGWGLAALAWWAMAGGAGLLLELAAR